MQRLATLVMIVGVTIAGVTILGLPLAAYAVDVGKTPGTVFKDCDTCPEMVVIPPGSFTQGRDGRDVMDPARYEGPVHDVTIGYSFAVGKTEV
ncbi:MAG: SUMF1/EgtB/PvdO family nonheme iron enzyme, partial [Rhodobacteraceae bacterium]|nr:SUMF1/EgtB/PvdO family nonheme iron enzyme [Paracoccaceae bacterium]